MTVVMCIEVRNGKENEFLQMPSIKGYTILKKYTVNDHRMIKLVSSDGEYWRDLQNSRRADWWYECVVKFRVNYAIFDVDYWKYLFKRNKSDDVKECPIK